MVPDLVLEEKSSGQLVILDTKFTAHSLVENQWGRARPNTSGRHRVAEACRSAEHDTFRAAAEQGQVAAEQRREYHPAR